MTGTVIILNAGQATRLNGLAPFGIKSLVETDPSTKRVLLDDQRAMFPGWDIYLAIASSTPPSLAGALAAWEQVTPLSIPAQHRQGSSLATLRAAVEQLRSVGKARPPFVCLYGDTVTADVFTDGPVAREWLGWSPASRMPGWETRPWEIATHRNDGLVVEYRHASHHDEKVHVGLFGWWDPDLPFAAGDDLLTRCARGKLIEVRGWWDVGDVPALDRYRRHVTEGR